MGEMSDTLDLTRYPLDDPSRIETLASSCRRELECSGMFNIEGSMRPAAVGTAVVEVRT